MNARDDKIVKWLLVAAALAWCAKNVSMSSTIVRIFVILCCLPMHELAHAWTAYKLGDSTAKDRGRISLNPLHHLTPEGVFFMLTLGFGFAKPVPVNVANFPVEKRKKYHVLTSLAGPVSNLLMALIFMIGARIAVGITHSSAGAVSYLATAAYLNITLAVFNLLPIPPLDGSSLLTIFMKGNGYLKIYKYSTYLIIGIFILSFLLHRLGYYPLSDISSAVFNTIWGLLILI